MRQDSVEMRLMGSFKRPLSANSFRFIPRPQVPRPNARNQKSETLAVRPQIHDPIITETPKR